MGLIGLLIIIFGGIAILGLGKDSKDDSDSPVGFIILIAAIGAIMLLITCIAGN